MAKRPYITGTGLPVKSTGIFIFLILIFSVVNGAVRSSKTPDRPELRKLPSPPDELNLEEIPFNMRHTTKPIAETIGSCTL
ncbi:MAG: hypothetical protein ACYSYL_19610 [Planctomycetota bacterium]|jgi:hypothetical protein